MSPEAKVPIMVGALLGAAALFSLLIWSATKEREEAARCIPGMKALGHRCCGVDQRLYGDRCMDPPSSCPEGFRIEAEGPLPGCVAVTERIRILGGEVTLGPNDWEAQGVVASREVNVGTFEIDKHEVSVSRWNACVLRNVCTGGKLDEEPGRPVTRVHGRRAAAFCELHGGRLPTGDEWLFAAATIAANKFPWGNTGLVCRRAVFGRVDGPCRTGAQGPELIGSVLEGTSPNGLLDMAGNVAEWTKEPDGSFVARGGSFRSTIAAELKTWSVRHVPAGDADDVGFRCAYDL